MIRHETCDPSQGKYCPAPGYRSTKQEDEPTTRYINEHTLRLHPVQKWLIEKTSQLYHSIMLSSADEIQLLQNLIRAINAKKALDIGTYTGYSALSIAMALPSDGKVITMDITDKFLSDYCQPAWKEAGVLDKIVMKIGPALETLDNLLKNGEAGSYDFAFIDADKENETKYYERCLTLIRPGGIIAIDNALFGGLVVNPESHDEKVVAIREVNDLLASDDRIYISMLTIGDGTTLCFKK